MLSRGVSVRAIARRPPRQNALLSDFIAQCTAESNNCRGNYETSQSIRRLSFGEEKTHTGGFIAVSKLLSSILTTSDFRKCRNEGYSMHHTSLRGKCFAAEAMKAAAPTESQDTCQRDNMYDIPWRIHIFGWYKKPRVALISSQIFIFWSTLR